MPKDSSLGLPNVAAHPSSPLCLPPDHCFSNDQEGLEARILIAGYARQLLDIDAVEHVSVHMVRLIVQRLNDVATRATIREANKLLASLACGPVN